MRKVRQAISSGQIMSKDEHGQENWNMEQEYVSTGDGSVECRGQVMPKQQPIVCIFVKCKYAILCFLIC
jgi:hypothetical protein